MRIAVTGAHGLTGGAIVRELAGRGHHVVAVVRRSAPVPLAAEVVVGDAADTVTLERALDAADGLVHVAGILLGEQLARCGAVRSVPRLTVVSTAALRSRHQPSADAYARNEEALRAARARVTIVRPTMIYGSPRDHNVHHVIDFARRWRFLPVPGAGTALIQPIHYEDLARATAVLAERTPPVSVEAGGRTAIPLRDAARAILQALGAPERLVHIPVAPARALAWMIDGARIGRWSERLARASEDRSVDNSALVALTGVHPRDFPSGVTQMVTVQR